jgi:hypothetical protein
VKKEDRLRRRLATRRINSGKDFGKILTSYFEDLKRLNKNILPLFMEIDLNISKQFNELVGNFGIKELNVVQLVSHKIMEYSFLNDRMKIF